MNVVLQNEQMDYVQSANTLFHFMKEPAFLYAALNKKGLVPRYCTEDISYLGININGKELKEISVLQKCFCDIPFHKLGENFPTQFIEDLDTLNPDDQKELKNYNTHLDYYGNYAISFSKSWSIRHNLQPVHYINQESEIAAEFKKVFEHAIIQSDLSDLLSDDIINRIAYFKPLQGEMRRILTNGTKVHINKNFNDEREWRYIPFSDDLEKAKKGKIIFKSSIQEHNEIVNKQLEDIAYENLWLKFDYDDIRYIIVPNISSRLELLEFIMNLDESNFKSGISHEIQKYLLISKILVLDEIRKDW